MIKIISILFLLLSVSNLVSAQDGYVKYSSEAEYRSKAIKVLKGEILPYSKTLSEKKVNIFIGKDTITDLAFPSDKFNTIENPNTTYLEMRQDLVQLKKDGRIYINAASIHASDTVTLISENGTQLIQLTTNRGEQVNKSDCGKYFRLIISNTPTIYYNADKLKQFVDSDQPKDGPTEPEIKETGLFQSLAWWHYLLVGLVLAEIVFLLWKKFKRKKIKHNKLVYKGGSLSQFAKPFGGLNIVSSLNTPGLIPNESEWNKIKGKEAGRNKIKELTGMEINVKSESEHSSGEVQTNFEEEKPKAHFLKSEGIKESDLIVRPSDYGNEDKISRQLSRLENKLLEAIVKSNYRDNNENQLTSLNEQIRNLKMEKKDIETEKEALENRFTIIQNEKSALQGQLQEANSENNRIGPELLQLKEKVISIDYLTGYCENILAYFKLSIEVVNDALTFFKKLSKQNLQQTTEIGYLLTNYQHSVNSLPVGNWVQTLQDIKDSGVTNNKLIKSSFKQLENTEERKKEFQRLLFSEVLVKYSSSVLLLAEALSKIEHFQTSSDYGKELQRIFSKHVLDLISKVKATGLENKYVPLFKNFEEFAGFTELANTEKSYPYNSIMNVEKESIIEIVSYGVKTPFEDTKTLIILA